MLASELPDCSVLAAAAAQEQLINDAEWDTGQVIAPPESDADQPAWLSALRSWREECADVLGWNAGDLVIANPALEWTQTAFVHVQMHPFDRYFFNQTSKRFTPRRWLADLRARYGGVDAALIWPTYTNLGIDHRNAYDMIEMLPGGLDELRRVIGVLHEEGVKALWPLMIWDGGTRLKQTSEEEAMASLLAATNADGVNGDTLYTMPRSFWSESFRYGRPTALQPELGGSIVSLPWTPLGWGEAGGWSEDLSSAAPLVAAYRWLMPEHMVSITRRWDTDRRDAIQHAWFNGIGYTAWENVWGIWNELAERDAESLRRVQPLMRFLATRKLLSNRGWEPHTPTLRPGSVFASKFTLPPTALPSSSPSSPAMSSPPAVPSQQPPSPQSPPPSPPLVPQGESRCQEAAWTLVERRGEGNSEISPVLALTAAEFGDCVFYDLYHGTPLAPISSGADQMTLAFPIEAHGFGCILATPNSSANVRAAEEASARQRVLTRFPLASFSKTRNTLHSQQAPVPLSLPPPPSHTSAPPGSVIIPGTTSFQFTVSGTVIEPFGVQLRNSMGVDVQFAWEDFPRPEHTALLKVPSFALDRAPVSRAQYARYRESTGYIPADERGYLSDWPDWRAGDYGGEVHTKTPVTGVSLAEARVFCAWAGGRLPSSVEWQYAAQAGDPTRLYPWGHYDDPTKRPAHIIDAHTAPPPLSSDTFASAATSHPFGLLDLVGNIWQFTSDEMQDEHTRFVLLRGGSRYVPKATNPEWVGAPAFMNWYFPTVHHRLDRHSKYFLMDDAYERAATLGFRCAYDIVPNEAAAKASQNPPRPPSDPPLSPPPLLQCPSPAPPMTVHPAVPAILPTVLPPALPALPPHAAAALDTFRAAVLTPTTVVVVVCIFLLLVSAALLVYRQALKRGAEEGIPMVPRALRSASSDTEAISRDHEAMITREDGECELHATSSSEQHVESTPHRC